MQIKKRKDKMNDKGKYFCDDCEIEMNETNKYGLHDICDDCETAYKGDID